MTIGRYPTLRVLGEGGMGTVYLTQHPHLEHYLVIKSLRPEYSQNEALLKRFYAEAQVLAGLSHPAIVRLYDFFTEEGVPYIVLEYVHGEPLDSYLARCGSLDLAATCHILSPIFSALDYLHRQKIIHRDIKPSNIMVLPEGGSKLIDFGIAKKLDVDLRLTQTGTQVGTVLYMAPEQIRGTETTPQTDLYAMGLVVYECLFGQYPWPWQNKNQFQIYQMLLTEPPPLPAWTPAAWQAFFLKALAKEPHERFASAEEMELALQNLTPPKAPPSANDNPSVTATPPSRHTESQPGSTPLNSADNTQHPQSALLSRTTRSAPVPATPQSSTPNKSYQGLVLWALISIGALVAGLIWFYQKRKAEQRLDQTANHINQALTAWFDSQKAALEKRIKHQVYKMTDGQIAPEVHLVAPYTWVTNRASARQFSQRGYLDGAHYTEVNITWTINRYTSEETEEECVYSCGFLWTRTCRGQRRVLHYYLTPYRCEKHLSLRLRWTIDETFRVQGNLDLETLLQKVSLWRESGYLNENSCAVSGERTLYRTEWLTDCQ